MEAVGLVLLANYNQAQNALWISTANALAGSVNEWRAAVTGYFALSDINATLTARNAVLERENAALRKQLESNTIDATAGLLAQVIDKTLHRPDNLITIDKGRAEGVEEDMCVMSGTGVVGTVYKVGKHHALVLPIINTRSSISCMIRRRGYFGYLRWQGGDTRYAYLEDVPRHARYAVGDKIETSGYSTLYPKGLTVGTVLCTFNSADGLAYRVKIALDTDFASLRDVYLLPKPEALSLDDTDEDAAV